NALEQLGAADNERQARGAAASAAARPGLTIAEVATGSQEIATAILAVVPLDLCHRYGCRRSLDRRHRAQRHQSLNANRRMDLHLGMGALLATKRRRMGHALRSTRAGTTSRRLALLSTTVPVRGLE